MLRGRQKIFPLKSEILTDERVTVADAEIVVGKQACVLFYRRWSNFLPWAASSDLPTYSLGKSEPRRAVDGMLGNEINPQTPAHVQREKRVGFLGFWN